MTAVALVTGASRGIGRAIAEALRDAGHRVEGVARDADALAELDGIQARPCDLTDADAVSRLVSLIGPVGVLVHSAGRLTHGRLEAVTAEDLEMEFRANVSSVQRLTHLLLPGLRSTRGDVVVIGSSAARHTRAGIGAFAASQAALATWADTLRHEVNADGIRVLTVFPGRTATARQAAIFEAEGRDYRPDLLLQPKAVADVVAAALSLPRTAEVTEIHLRPAIKSY